MKQQKKFPRTKSSSGFLGEGKKKSAKLKSWQQWIWIHPHKNA